MSSPAVTSAADGTADLLARAREGDRDALDQLFARHVPALRRWASGRLPRWARDATDTSDLVQDTVLATFRRLDAFEPRGEGALQAYLRQAVINRIRTQLRNARTRPAPVELASDVPDQGTSPIEAAIGGQTAARYESALERLRPEEREAIVARVEFGMSFAEVAELLDKPSPDAARMAVVRALVRLAEEMGRPS
jgi:RNA polymerase sigma factor (sigma-70 family)